MNKSKKLFIILAAVFLIVMAFFIWDFARRTKFRRPSSGLIIDQNETNNLNTASSAFGVV